MEDSKVVKFYENKNILITGATGFLGKVLLWKILKSCPNTGKIYVLLRSKNTCSANNRLVQMLKAKPFSGYFDDDFLLNKVTAMEGDVTAHGLGLSRTDRALLEDQVNIVLHCAASVKFDAPLKDNMRDNLQGTREIIHLCDNIKNLNAFVHVSTAYSNCHLKDIKEELVPVDMDVEEVIKLVESISDETCEKTTPKMLEGRPNTYTYTKALAEHYVAKNEGKYPISIVRPSIVISSFEEPHVGWIDNINGIGGLGCLACIGLLRTIDWNYYATSDMVPVDFVANCIICSAFQASTVSPDKITFYNMTSGNMKPVSWGNYFDMLRENAVERPPNKIVRPMIKAPKHNRANPVEFLLTKFFSELLFAYMIDTILTLIGYKKIMVKITSKMHHGYKILKPFTINEWNFTSDNVINLSESLSEKERNEFRFDMRDFDWNEQAKKTYDGARLYLLKEEPTEASFKSARSRQKFVTIVHYAGMGLIMGSVALVSYAGLRLLRAF